MLRTPLCDRLGIAVPILQAPIGPWAVPELAAAAANAGALGSIVAMNRPADALKDDIARLRQLTDRPFAVNHVLRVFAEDAFAATLAARPPVVWTALGDPGDLVDRAHDADALHVHQVHTVAQAVQAAERGVDVIVAQGGEAGGFGGTVGTMALVPQVVDAVAPLPVVAAGGIADGRGLAAALVLGAQGVNVGTRFVACRESPAHEDWKRRIVAATSEDAVRAEFFNDISPVPAGAYETLPRVLRTPFVEEWNRRRADARLQAQQLNEEVMAAMMAGRVHEVLPFTGQSAGLVHEVLPAAEVVRTLVADAEAALAAVAAGA
jgi:nitronate monooxygenase/enoyl-[acyl-carrier protein] reductase II